jgi:hypothetical protein
LKDQPNSKQIINIIKDDIYENVDFSFITCSDHKAPLVEKIIQISCRTLVHSWCKDVNRKLTGQHDTGQDSRPYSGHDAVKKEAVSLYLNRRKK